MKIFCALLFLLIPFCSICAAAEQSPENELKACAYKTLDVTGWVSNQVSFPEILPGHRRITFSVPPSFRPSPATETLTQVSQSWSDGKHAIELQLIKLVDRSARKQNDSEPYSATVEIEAANSEFCQVPVAGVSATVVVMPLDANTQVLLVSSERPKDNAQLIITISGYPAKERDTPFSIIKSINIKD